MTLELNIDNPAYRRAIKIEIVSIKTGKFKKSKMSSEKTKLKQNGFLILLYSYQYLIDLSSESLPSLSINYLVLLFCLI